VQSELSHLILRLKEIFSFVGSGNQLFRQRTR